MNPQQEMQMIAAVTWLAILLGPALALAWATLMFYVDGATRGLTTHPVQASNRAALVMLVIGFAVWVLLLKFLYLPLIGFDTNFLSLDGITRYNYTDIYTLRVLWDMTLAWIGRAPVSAIALLAFPVLLAAAVLMLARSQGRAAALPRQHTQAGWH